MNKKELKREYMETPRPMGVFQIRNLTNEKVWVSSSVNLDGIFNRHRFALNAGQHQNKELQKDWSEAGAEQFVFEILEEIEPRAGVDSKRELEILEDLWLEKLAPYGERGYNAPKRTREERLRMIGANKKPE